MREFSQLLDGLVYTRSRNAKLKLIGDYLKATLIRTAAMRWRR
jgi:DNA ligase-1